MDGFTYERAAIFEWVKKKGQSPITSQPAALGDLHSTQRVVEDALREGVADHEAAKLAKQLVQGHTPELANVPLQLRKLRKAAVAALHKFNTTESVAKQKRTNAKEGDKEKDDTEGTEEELGGGGEKKAVGLVLAT